MERNIYIHIFCTDNILKIQVMKIQTHILYNTWYIFLHGPFPSNLRFDIRNNKLESYFISPITTWLAICIQLVILDSEKFNNYILLILNRWMDNDQSESSMAMVYCVMMHFKYSIKGFNIPNE